MERRTRILIVEDKLIIAEDLSDILNDNDYEVIAKVRDYENALEVLRNDVPDLVLVDIMIKGEKDGIELAAKLRSDFDIPFIFISSHSDKATIDRAKGVNPYGYIVKPFEENDVLVAIEMGLNNYQAELSARPTDKNIVLDDCIFVRQGNMVVKVGFNDIHYIQADANYSTLFTADKKYVVRITLKELEDRLPADFFFRCHKSYIINLRNLEAINHDVVLIGGSKLPIGRKQQSWLMENIRRI